MRPSGDTAVLTTSMASTQQPFRALAVGVVLMVISGFAPALVMALLGWDGGVNVATLIGMAVFLACMGGNGWRTGLNIALPLAVLAGLAQWAAPNPWLAALVLAVAAFLRGYAAKVGMHDALIMSVISLGFLVSSPVPQTSVNSSVPIPIYVFLVSLITASWATFVIYLLRHRLHARHHTGLNPIRVLAFSLVLAFLVAVTTWFVVDLNLGHTGAWIILTIVVVFQPALGDGFRKAAYRATGTVVGFVIAIAVGLVVPNGPLLYLVGTVFLLGAFILLLQGRPYWVFAAALTPAIVLLESADSTVYVVAEERLGATLIGVLCTVLVMLALLPLTKRLTVRSQARSSESPKG